MNFRQTTVMMLMLIAIVSTAGAAAYLETWDGGTTESWNIEDIDGLASYASLDWDTAPLLDGEYEVLRIEGGGVQGGIIEDIIYADGSSSGGNIIENDADGSDFTGGYYVTFDFYASEVPVSLDIYFEDTSDVQWVTSVTLPSTGWNDYLEVLSYSTDWNRLDGGTESATTFSTSLTEVDEIGIVIGYTGSGTEVYALDNFMVVPEPEEWLMIGVALISLSFAFRKRLIESLAVVRVRRY